MSAIPPSRRGPNDGGSHGPFVLRQRKRLEKDDPIKLESHNSRGDRVIYSGIVKDVSPDGKSIVAIVRTGDGFVEMKLELP